MGKASSSKKVARAARTGGGRTRRGTTSWGWPLAMTVVVALGVLLVVESKSGQQADASPPRRNLDHWHTAIGFDLCGEFAAPIDDQSDPLGIHTHGDGVIHVHPFVDRASGSRATLSRYFETVKAKVDSDEIDLPAQAERRNGMKCGGRRAVVQTRVWSSRDPENKGEIYEGDPGDIRLRDNQLITIAFLPEGEEIPRPPSEAELDRLTDIGPAATIPGEVTPPAPEPPADPPPITVAGDAPTTAP